MSLQRSLGVGSRNVCVAKSAARVDHNPSRSWAGWRVCAAGKSVKGCEKNEKRKTKKSRVSELPGKVIRLTTLVSLRVMIKAQSRRCRVQRRSVARLGSHPAVRG